MLDLHAGFVAAVIVEKLDSEPLEDQVCEQGNQGHPIEVEVYLLTLWYVLEQ